MLKSDHCLNSPNNLYTLPRKQVVVRNKENLTERDSFDLPTNPQKSNKKKCMIVSIENRHFVLEDRKLIKRLPARTVIKTFQ